MMLAILATDSLALLAAAEDALLAKPHVEAWGGGRVGSVKPNYQPNPAPKLSPAKIADNGQIRLTEGIIQTDTVPSCPGIKIPSVIIFNTSSPGFTGTDTCTLVPGTDKPRDYKVIVAPEA